MFTFMFVTENEVLSCTVFDMRFTESRSSLVS